MSIYKNISNSIEYYKNLEYIYLEDNISWIVEPDISNITKPIHKQDFYIKNDVLVGSGEQSFLQLLHYNELKPGKYVCATPCFRDEINDETHKTYFMKTELINTINTEFTDLQNMVNDAFEFYSEYLEVEIIQIDDNSFDIIDKKTQIELGSYSIKTYNNIKWICGTGCAEPRLTICLRKNKKLGYHNSYIQKSKLGSYRKIQEEFEEFIDAVQSKNKIMGLVELSDLLGAIKFYLKDNFNDISLDDLIIMNNTTQKAFENNRR